MKIYDISMIIHEDMPVYRNRDSKRPRIIREQQLPHDAVNESAIHMNLHTGSHLDGPLHMLADGHGSDAFPLKRLMGPCRVVDLCQVEDAITREDLVGSPIPEGGFVLLKTQNSLGRVGDPDFVYLRADGAQYLVEKGIRGLGMDALGVERDQAGHPTHKTLMNADVLIIEGLALKGVPAGDYVLIALPLSIQGVEGAPLRAILLDQWPKNPA